MNNKDLSSLERCQDESDVVSDVENQMLHNAPLVSIRHCQCVFSLFTQVKRFPQIAECLEIVRVFPGAL